MGMILSSLIALINILIQNILEFYRKNVYNFISYEMHEKSTYYLVFAYCFK